MRRKSASAKHLAPSGLRWCVRYWVRRMVIVVIAIVISIVLVQWALPFFNQLTDKNISFNTGNIFYFIGASILLTVVTGLVAGSYPAFYLVFLSSRLGCVKGQTKPRQLIGPVAPGVGGISIYDCHNAGLRHIHYLPSTGFHGGERPWV